MSEAVTDVIVSRSREPQGLKTMVMCSTAAHMAAFVVLAIMPSSSSSDVERPVMMISLNAGGPETSGMTPMGGRAVQAVQPPEAVRRPDTAPASPREAMTLPSPNTRPDKRPERSTVTSPSRTPAVGEEITDGNARANTRLRGQGFGLAGGGGTSGDAIQVDPAFQFCCQAYLETMKAVIQRNWSSNQGRVAATTIKFTIARSGGILEPQVEIASGFADLDSMALRAVQLAKLPSLPAEYTNPMLTVHVRFDYER